MIRLALYLNYKHLIMVTDVSECIEGNFVVGLLYNINMETNRN